MHGRWQKWLAWLPPAVLIAMLTGLALAGSAEVFERPALVAVSYLFFALPIGTLIAFLAGRGYLLRGDPGLAWLASGAILWGGSGLVGGALSAHSPNAGVTAHNLLVWLAAACHFAGVKAARPPSPRAGSPRRLAAHCAGAVLAVPAVAWVAAGGMLPVFLSAATGGTPIRQFVLISAIAMFVAAAVTLHGPGGRAQSAFRERYAQALVLIVVGLTAVLSTQTPGTAISWAGRFAQLLGSAYMLAAAVAALKEAGKGEAFSLVLDSPAGQLDGVMEMIADGIVVHEPGANDDACRFVYANPAVCQMLGFTPADMARLALQDIIAADELAGLAEDKAALLSGGRLVHEKTLVAADGRRLAASIHSRLFHRGGRDLVVSVIRDVSERKAIEEALHDSERRLRQLIATLPGMVWTATPDGTIDFISQQWLDYTGTELESQLGAGAFGAIHPGDRDRVVRLWQEAVGSRAGFHVEYRLRRHDGSYRWFKSRGTPTIDEAGGIVRWLGVVIDIDDLKATQEALRENRERLRLALDAAEMVTFGHDFAANRVVRQGKALRYLDLPEEGPGADFFERIHPDDRPGFFAILHGIVPEQPAYRAEYRLRQGDGSYRWLEDHSEGLFDEAGRLAGAHGVIRDIMARKETEARLLLQSERQALLLEVTSGILQTWGDKAEMARVLFERIKDHLQADVCFNYRVLPAGQGMALIAALGLPAGQEEDFRHLAPGQAFCGAAAASGNCVLADRERIESDPAGAFVRRLGLRAYMVHPLRGLDGQVMGTLSLGSFRRERFVPEEADFLRALAYFLSLAWEQRRAEARIKELNADLERRVEERTAELTAANRQLESFTFATSHDLRGPLGRINSFSALLEQQYRRQLEGDGLVFLGFIRQNAVRLNQLVDDLLEHARIAQQDLESEVLDVVAAVHAVLQEKEDDIGKAGARIRVDLVPGRIRGDRHAFQQALANIVDNALKYSARATPPLIDIRGQPTDGRYRLEVRDNGVGFDMAYHDRIFEMFRRLHAYSEYPGTGIGLALVKRAMERMGGRVWAESEVGGGARFFLELAAAP